MRNELSNASGLKERLFLFPKVIAYMLLSPIMISIARTNLLAIKLKGELHSPTILVLHSALFSFNRSNETIFKNALIYVFMSSLTMITCHFSFYFHILQYKPKTNL